MKFNKCKSKYYLKSAGYLLWDKRYKHFPESVFGITYQTWEDMRKNNKEPRDNKMDDSYRDLGNFTFPKSYCTNKLQKGSSL